MDWSYTPGSLSKFLNPDLDTPEDAEPVQPPKIVLNKKRKRQEPVAADADAPKPRKAKKAKSAASQSAADAPSDEESEAKEQKRSQKQPRSAAELAESDDEAEAKTASRKATLKQRAKAHAEDERLPRTVFVGNVPVETTAKVRHCRLLSSPALHVTFAWLCVNAGADQGLFRVRQSGVCAVPLDHARESQAAAQGSLHHWQLPLGEPFVRCWPIDVRSWLLCSAIPMLWLPLPLPSLNLVSAGSRLDERVRCVCGGGRCAQGAGLQQPGHWKQACAR